MHFILVTTTQSLQQWLLTQMQLGKQVADMVEKIANGEKVSDIPYETISDYAKYVNMQAVKQFGGKFDKKAFEGFDVLVEEDGTSHFNK